MAHVRVQTTSISSDIKRYFACAKCGFNSPVVVMSRGQGQSLADFQERTLATERAKAALGEDTQRMLDMVPCPECGTRKDVATHHRKALLLALVKLPPIVAVSFWLAALFGPSKSISFEVGVYTWAGFSLLGAAIVYFGHLGDRKRAPNAVLFVEPKNG